MTEGSVLIERYIEAYNAARWDDLRALLSGDYVHHSGPSDLDFESFCLGAGWIRGGLPDFTVRIDDQIADRDRIAVRFTGTGTHTGSFDTEPPSGRTVTVYGTTIFRVEQSLIAEDWEALDEQPFRELLG